MLRALIFDVDGTLADTERDGHRVAFNRAFVDAGLDWQWDENEYGELLHVAGGPERLRHFANLRSEVLTDETLKNIHQRKTWHYLHLCRERGIAIRPGVARLIDEAHRAGLVLAIATTTSRANVDALLPIFPKHTFSVIGTAEDAGKKKPDPAIFLFVLDELRLSATECVAFEDSQAGLAAAAGANLSTIITINEYTRQQDFTGAFAVVSDLGEREKPAHVLAGPSLDGLTVDLAYVRRAVSS